MKKSTLVVLLLAAALGGYVYYSEFRHPQVKLDQDAPVPLYGFTGDEVTSVQVKSATAAAPVALERHSEGWVLTSPVEARADRGVADSLADAIARAASVRRMPADPARMKEFGLQPPAVTIEFKLKNGQTKLLDLGAKDFSGMNVYAHPGGAKEVLLMPDSLLTDATRSVNELRDRAVLQLGAWSLAELDFHTAKARFRLEKKGDNWELTEPRQTAADGDEAASLSNALSSARFSDVVEEQANDGAALGRYGLVSPELAIHVRNEQGAEASLLIGKKDDNKYFAHDAARSMVFRVEDSLVKKFVDATLTSLRDKHILRGKADDFSQLTIRNEKLTLTAARSPDGKWLIQEPADRKGKALSAWRVFEPLISSRATEVIDQPSAGILARLAKPVVEIKLTDPKGVATTVVVSAKDGNSIYARSSRSPVVFKVDASTLDQLNFTAAEAAP
jgi:uncharacterized protein DUF4340